MNCLWMICDHLSSILQSADERNPAQFIITTFHPQIIEETDKVYGVAHQNRISTVEVMTKEDAFAFFSREDSREPGT